MRWAIWYYLYNLKNVRNTQGGKLTLVKLRSSACKFTKLNTPLWVFFTFFKLYKWYQIAQFTKYGFLMISREDTKLEKKVRRSQLMASYYFFSDCKLFVRVQGVELQQNAILLTKICIWKLFMGLELNANREEWKY